MQRNAVRQGRSRVPDVGIHATLARLRQPAPADGFDAVLAVRIGPDGGFEVLSAGQEMTSER